MSGIPSYNLLNGKHKDRVWFTAEAMVYIVSNGTLNLICGLLDKLGERVSITEEVVEAARHERSCNVY